MGTPNSGGHCFKKSNLKGTSYSLTKGPPKGTPNWGGIYFKKTDFTDRSNSHTTY